MSSEVWAMGMLRKHKLGVDFCLNFVEDNWGMRYYWGNNNNHLSFEDCLQHVVKVVEGRK